MKKIIFAGIFAVFSNFTTAQVVIPATGSYTTNNTMGAFHGTWQWVSGVDTLKIILSTKKVYVNINGGYFEDMLVGWHIYKRGNSVIESSFANINIVNGRTFLGSNEDEPPGVVTGTFKDLSKNKYGELTLTLSQSNTQLIWNLKSTPGLKIRGPGEPPHQPGFTVPTYMILIKQ
jgi:hypothetical protein